MEKQNGSKHFTNAPASTQIKQKFVNPSHETSPKALPLIDQNQMRQFGWKTRWAFLLSKYKLIRKRVTRTAKKKYSQQDNLRKGMALIATVFHRVWQPEIRAENESISLSVLFLKGILKTTFIHWRWQVSARRGLNAKSNRANIW